MIISIVAAVDQEGGIGLQNQIPWHLPSDLARFKKLTMGHHLILGRKTYQSIWGPLPGRRMIVLSRDPDFRPDGGMRASSLTEAYQIAIQGGEAEVFVIGGGEIYQRAFLDADRLYLTCVKASFEADTTFPEWDRDDWHLICSQAFPASPDNPYAYTFSCWVRKWDVGVPPAKR